MKIHQHNRAKYFLLPLLMLLMVSCEKEANISLDNVEDKVVVFSTFTPDQPFTLELSRSTSLFSNNSSESLEQAEIQICKGENCELLGPPSVSGTDDIKLRFTTRNFRPQINIPYSLKLKVDGISEIISAQASVPVAIPLTHVAVGLSTELPSDDSDNPEKKYETRVSLSFDDPVGEDNYYQVNFYQIVDVTDGSNLVINTDTIPSIAYVSIDPDLVNLRNVTDDGILIDGKNFDGLTRDLLFRPIFQYNINNEKPTSIRVELRSVSKEYFDYYSSVYRQINQGSDPFIQPAQIVSNINNGLGIFAGYSKDAVIRDLEL